jgi:hypothetical protein
MAKRRKKEGKTPLRYAMSREEVEAIFAVEGLKLTPEAEQRLKETEGMSPEEWRALTIQAFEKMPNSLTAHWTLLYDLVPPPRGYSTSTTLPLRKVTFIS